MEKMEIIPMQDFPENTAKELERLHKQLDSSIAHQRDWAEKKIDQIHAAFFNALVLVKGQDNGN